MIGFQLIIVLIVFVVFLFTFVLFVHARVKPTTEATKIFLRLRFDGIFAIFAAIINFYYGIAMKKNNLLLRLAVLVTAVMCALGASAAEAYANFTPSYLSLTFYYDDLRSTRQGTTYDLNTGSNLPGWFNLNKVIYHVAFDPSFANARPTSTYAWFFDMGEIVYIAGLNYLNTSEVTDMTAMFANCTLLPSLDVSHFNTSKVINMHSMFSACWELTDLDLSSFNTSNVTNMQEMFLGSSKLRTIYVGDGWSTDAVTNSTEMFFGCPRLVGGQGTTYDANHLDKAYAHIDGGPSNPGYFTKKPDLGDVDCDNDVTISDVTALIDYLLSGDDSGIYLAVADCNQDSWVSIDDVTALIDYLLSHHW